MKTFLLLSLVSVSLVRLPAQTNPPSGATLVFYGAELNQVLKVYAQASGNTLIRHPGLASAPITFQASPTNSAEVAALLEKLLADHGISVIQDGQKFAIIVPKSQASSVHPHAPLAASGETIPIGAVNFTSMNFRQVAAVYANLQGRKLDETNLKEVADPHPFQLEPQAPLAKNELIYALDTLFEFRGIRFITTNEGLIKPMRIVPSPKPMR